MTLTQMLNRRFSFSGKYYLRWMLVIAIFWTVSDLIWNRFFHFSINLKSDNIFRFNLLEAMLLRGIIVFFMSCFMVYILLFKLKQYFRDMSLLINLLAKTGILLLGSLVMNFLLHFSYSIFILHVPVSTGLQMFFGRAGSFVWLLRHSIGWITLFLITQLAIELYEKYSPGVFWDIFIGRYIKPKVQKRIVMFIDLTDSTPTAEKLTSLIYFSFIRDFIYFVSVALLEYDGRIYQYVGDEIVVSWAYNSKNINKCLDALTMSSKLLQRKSAYFMRHYGVVPEFKAGVHAGEVTIGEIGLIKKDLAMSGDTMNTAARIREQCNELKQKCIISKDFLNGNKIEWEVESLGLIELKGKSEGMELFGLKM